MVDVGDGDAVFVGRYHCLERFGIGPVGERWRARLYGLGGFEKEVSIVRVHATLGDDPVLRPRLIRAVSLAAQVPIDGLVRVHDVGVDGDRLHLVADAIRGLPLDELRERLYACGRRIPIELVMRVLRDVAWTMAQAHSRVEVGPVGLCHLAITEAAIVIDPDGRPRLLDAGLIPALVRPGWLAAPPPGLDLRALAPEVAGGAWFDARSDVYAIGRLGQRLCATVRPSPIGPRGGFWEDEDTEDRAAAVAALGRIVDRAASDDPDARHPSLVALIAELDGLFEAARPRVVVEGVVEEEGTTAFVERREEPRIELTHMGESTSRIALGALVAKVREEERDSAPTSIVVAPPTVPEQVAGPPYEEPLESQITNRVPLPEQQALMAALPQTLPPPPTLPLTALRDPVRARLGEALKIGAFVVGGLMIAGAIAGGVLLGRAGRGARPAASAVEDRADRGPLGDRSRAIAPAGVARADAQPEARVQISTDPPGALVIIDGVARGRAPIGLGLARGPHKLALLLDGYELVREPMPIDGARTVVRVLQPARMPAALVGYGGLKVRCHRNAGLPLRIFIDDIDTGHDCPNDERIALTPGRHSVGLYLPDRDELVAVRKPADISPSGRTARLYLTY